MPPTSAGHITETGSARSSLALLLLLACLFSAGVIYYGWMTEDAYITLRVVDNFVNGFGLRWNVDERVQVFTHPLWLLVMIPFYALTHEAFYTIILLGAVIAVAAFFLPARRLMAASPWAAGFFCIGLLSSKAILQFSTGGLENPLAMLVLAVFYLLMKNEQPITQRHWFYLHLMAALLLLTRFDVVLLAAPALAALWWHHKRKDLALPAFCGLIPFFLWEIFSLIYYGFLFPNTKYAKLDYTGLSHLDYLYQSRFYLLDLVQNHLPTALLLVASVGVGFAQIRRRKPWPLPALLAAGVVLYVGYILWIGSDHYSGRYWAVPAFLAALLLADIIATTKAKRLAKVLIAGLAASLVIGHFVESHKLMRPGKVEDAYGLSKGVFTLFAYHPENHPWAADGMKLRKFSKNAQLPIVLPETAIGMRGYFAGPKVILVDWLGIADALMARLPVADKGRWHASHYWRKRPGGYVNARSAGSVITNPALNAYYGRLRTITSAPIWSPERLKTIVFFNLGVYDDLRKEYIAKAYYYKE